MKRDKPTMYTIKQAADIIGAAPSSIRAWLSDEHKRAERFPGAVLITPEDGMPGVPYWLIPETDLQRFKMGKPGPKSRKDSKKNTG